MLSVRQFDKDNFVFFEFESNKYLVKSQGTNNVLQGIDGVDELYSYIPGCNSYPPNSSIVQPHSSLFNGGVRAVKIKQKLSICLMYKSHLAMFVYCKLSWLTVKFPHPIKWTLAHLVVLASHLDCILMSLNLSTLLRINFYLSLGTLSPNPLFKI